MYKLLISKALRYGPRVTRGSHRFTCHPHTNHTGRVQTDSIQWKTEYIRIKGTEFNDFTKTV